MGKWLWILGVLLCAGVAWAQESTLVPLGDTAVRFTPHASTSVSIDFLKASTQEQTAHYDLTPSEWGKFTDACRRAVNVAPDPNDPDYQHIDQIAIATVAGIKIWRLIEPQVGPAVVMSAGRKTLAEAGGKYLYLFLKSLSSVSAQLQPSTSPSP